MRHRHSSGPHAERSNRRPRAALASLALALAVCPLIGGCPPSQVMPGKLESQMVLDKRANDLEILENAMSPEEHAALAVAGETVTHVVGNGEDFYLYETDISPEVSDRIQAADITHPTRDIFLKTKAGLCWMEGQPNGPFIMRPFIFTGPIEPFNADNFVAGDFNNDQKMDVAVAHHDDSIPVNPTTMRLFLGDGAGGFTPGQALNLPGIFLVQTLTAGDVNSDTLPDLLAVGADACRILVGQSNGTFLYLDTTTGATSASPTTPLPGARTGRLAQFNAGPSADIVLSPNTGGVSVRLGNGNGTFQPSVSLPGIQSFNLVIDDFDADDVNDIVLAGGAPSVVAIYHGTAGGGIAAPLLLAGGQGADRVGVFYAPGDDRPDLFTVHKFDDVIQTFLNTDQGWRVARRAPFVDQLGEGIAPRDGALLDLNGDDYLDIAAGDVGGLLSFTLNTGDGTGAFLPTRAEDLLATVTHVHALHPLAGQSDARALVVTTHTPFRFSNVMRLNTSVVPNVWSVVQMINSPVLPTDVTSADFTGDGREDLVYSHAVAPGSISLLAQDAAGVFGPRQAITVTGGAWNAVCAVDLDGANGSDVLVADTAAGKVQALMNTGAGGFVAGASFVAPAPLSLNVAVGDITGDGKADIVVGAGPAGGMLGSVRVYPTEAGDAFGSPFVIPFARLPVRVAVHDINADGRLDILAATKPTASGGDGVTGLVVNSATGIMTFPPSYHYASGEGVWVGAADLRHAVTDAPDGAAKPTPTVVVLGTPQGPPYESMTLLDTVTLAQPCAGDANGDSVVDFLDLNIVLSDFGLSGAPGALQGDLDSDGDCDFIDLNIVLSAFGTAC